MTGSVPDPAPRPLGLGTSLLRPAHTWSLIAAVLGGPMLVLAGLALAIGSGSGAGAGEVLATVWTELVREPGHRLLLWALAVLAPLAGLMLAGQRLASLRITSAGLQGYIPRWLGVGWFRQSAGRWEIRWEQVRRVQLIAPTATRSPVQRLGWYRLVIETDRGETWLNPFAWFDRVGRDHRLGLGELLARARLDPDRRVQSAPLVGALRARGFRIESGEAGAESGAPGFDLARHGGMATQLVLFFAAGAYALADTFFLTAYVPLGRMPVWPFMLTAVAAALAVAMLGRGAPRTERLAVGVLVVGAMVAAVHPATLRLNAATAEPEIATYVAVGPGRFEPREPHLPTVALGGTGLEAYWRQYPPGREHEFTLLQGSAGFHQLDLAPLYERTRRFYSRRRNGD